jgi:hypothetical protein
MGLIGWLIYDFRSIALCALRGRKKQEGGGLGAARRESCVVSRAATSESGHQDLLEILGLELELNSDSRR